MRRSVWIFVWLSLSGVLLGQPSERVVTQTRVEGYGSETVAQGDVATLSYVLRLAGGDIIDSSARDKPLSFTVGSHEVIPGFSQGILGMKMGESREITVPPSLGYGSASVGPIPANSTLNFEVKLLGLTKETEVDPDLSEVFGREGYGSRPSAEELDRPAVFEYLIRDFFTRPWRYPDAAEVIWKSNATLTGVALLLLALVLRLPRGRQDQE